MMLTAELVIDSLCVVHWITPTGDPRKDIHALMGSAIRDSWSPEISEPAKKIYDFLQAQGQTELLSEFEKMSR